MQVRSHNVGLGIPAGLTITKRNNIRTQEASTLKSRKAIEAFPESGFLSIKPLRYNVQLNCQLTSLQRAEHYLLETERQLSQLQQVVNQDAATIKRQSQKLLSWLEQREIVSGGTIDRRLKISLAGNAQVNFTVDGASQLLYGAESETLLFALANTASSVVAVKLTGQHSPQHKLRQLNNALGRLGIHGTLANHQLVFQTDERQWKRINKTLTVRGDGCHYPADKFQPLELQAQEVLENKVSNIVSQPMVIREQQNTLQQELTQITDQLHQLNKFKDNARERVSGMAGFITSDNAIIIAERLASKQFAERSSYAVDAQIVRGQGYLHPITVRNLFIG